MAMLCDATVDSQSSTPATAVAGHMNPDTALTVLFPTMGLVLAALQVILSWQSVRALRRRDAPS
jgi:hypothetical protein